MNVSFVTDQLHSVGEDLVQLNNTITFLSLEASNRIKTIQTDLIEVIGSLQGGKEEADCVPTIPDDALTSFERTELAGLEATQACMISSWRHVEKRKRAIYQAAMERIQEQRQDRERREGGQQ